MKKKIDSRSISLMGLLMAMQIVLTRFLSIQTPIVRIGFSFIPIVMMGMMFNPLIAGVGNLFADFIGIMIFGSSGPYFPGFSLTAFMSGATYSLFFYKKEMSVGRIILACLVVTLLCDVVLNTLWLYMMAPASIAQFPIRLGKSAILLPIKVMIVYAISNNPIIREKMRRFS